MAINACVVPLAIVGLTGEMPSETNVAFVTVRVVVPEMLPSVAVIVAVPTFPAVAFPCVPAALLTTATFVSDDVQATCVVRSCVVASE